MSNQAIACAGSITAAPGVIVIERGRYAALIEALKLARYTFRMRPFRSVGMTDTWRVASAIEAALAAAEAGGAAAGITPTRTNQGGRS